VPPMEISIAQIGYFCVLADELHYGVAARRLRISSPSLSQQISRLESAVGCRLFERTPRHVELTDDGRALLPLAQAARDAHHAVLDWASDRQQDRGGLLRVGVVAAGAGPLTTIALTAAIAQMPGVRLEMRRLGFFDAATEVAEGRVDVAFAPAPLHLPPGVRGVEVAREGRVLVVAAGHRFAGRPWIDIAETTGEVFIAPAHGDPKTIAWWVVDPRPDGTRPTRGPVADDIEGILELCAAGVGVNIAAASVESHYRREDLAFVPIRDIEPASILLCTPEQPSNPEIRAFEAIVLQRVDSGRPSA
jgi:DNA-binding transcriptional LysR family regulator